MQKIKSNNAQSMRKVKRHCPRCTGKVELHSTGFDQSTQKGETVEWFKCWKCGEYYPIYSSGSENSESES